jgi:tyrosine-protein phosphatase SIW14
MSRPVLTLFRVLLILALIAAPAGYALHEEAQTRNFRVVCPGVLYRSGQMSRAGLRRVLHDYGIKTVINLREGVADVDRDEEHFCRREEVLFVRIPPRHWWDPSGPAPAEEGVQTFLAVMADPRNHPVLVHCFGGVHRAGAYSALYRMEFEHWTNEQALAEMKACGYTTLDDEWDILGYLEQYVPTWARPKGE